MDTARDLLSHVTSKRESLIQSIDKRPKVKEDKRSLEKIYRGRPYGDHTTAGITDQEDFLKLSLSITGQSSQIRGYVNGGGVP
ncbi:hypothetical protein Tco_0469709 [Tanacetum coccineum]